MGSTPSVWVGIPYEEVKCPPLITQDIITSATRTYILSK